MDFTTLGRGSRPLVINLIAAALVACGGGGGGDGSGEAGPLRGTLILTPANRDSAAHAVAGGALGLGDVDQALATASALRKAVARLGREHVLSVLPSMTAQCGFGGTMTETVDDRDDNGAPSVGDVVTIVFALCRDSANMVTDGMTRTEVLAVSGSTIRTRVTATQLLIDQGLVTDPAQAHHKTTMNGTTTVDMTQSATIVTTHLTTETLTMALQTPMFTDTVKLLPGFEEVLTEDSAAIPPEGSRTPGRAGVTLSGMLESSATGGILSVVTDQPSVAYAGDRFPRSGVLRALGSTGTLRITALSTEQVQIDLDVNDDGTYENTNAVRWDWLI